VCVPFRELINNAYQDKILEDNRSGTWICREQNYPINLATYLRTGINEEKINLSAQQAIVFELLYFSCNSLAFTLADTWKVYLFPLQVYNSYIMNIAL
jgi:hypothetical protein